MSLFTADFGTDAGPNLQLDSWQSETQMSHDQFLFVYLCVFRAYVRACNYQNLYRRKPGLFLNCARLPENMEKNRYRDVLPCKLFQLFLQLFLHHISHSSFWPWREAAVAQAEILSARGSVWVWPSRSLSVNLLSDDSTRVVLQGQENYINASHITVGSPDAKHSFSCLIYIFKELVLCVWCLCVRVSGSASGVWHMFTLRCSSGSVATDVHALLADCLGAADTHHHHANNADREGTGIHTWLHTLTECLPEHCFQDLKAMDVHTSNSMSQSRLMKEGYWSASRLTMKLTTCPHADRRGEVSRSSEMTMFLSQLACCLVTRCLGWFSYLSSVLKFSALEDQNAQIHNQFTFWSW